MSRLLVLAACLAGCLAIDPPDGSLCAATTTSVCPDGQTCVNGVCMHATTADIGVSSDGGADLQTVDLEQPDFAHLVPVPTTLVFSAQPQPAAPSVTLSPAVKVTVLDQIGNPLTTMPYAVTIALDATPTAGAVLSGTTTLNTDGTGSASFGSLKVDKAGQGYTLLATGAGLQAVSSPFNIVAGLADPPTGITATTQSSSIALMWSAVAGAVSYNVLRGTAAGGPYAQVATPTGTSIIDGPLRRGTYYYVLQTVNAIGASANSVEISAFAERELCVTNYTGNSVVAASSTSTTGNALRSMSTGVSTPISVAVDLTNNEIFIADFIAGTVIVYDRLAISTSAAKRKITGLSRPSSLVVDPGNSELYIADFDDNLVAVYDRAASGATPTVKRTLSGANTTLSGPIAIALTAAGELFVGNSTDTVTVFPRTASGNVVPTRTLGGPATTMSSVSALVFDEGNAQLLVASQGGTTISAFARTASGNTLPSWYLQGASTGLAMPAGITVDTAPLGGGEIYVTNSSTVTVYPAKHSACGAPCVPLDLTPTRTLSSPSFSGPTGISLCN